MDYQDKAELDALLASMRSEYHIFLNQLKNRFVEAKKADSFWIQYADIHRSAATALAYAHFKRDLKRRAYHFEAVEGIQTSWVIRFKELP